MDPERASVPVVALPGVDRAVGTVRRAHDPSTRDGMPAHVTLLTPFVPVDEWGAPHAVRLSAALATVAPFEARFRRTGPFGRTTVFVVPEPEESFARLATTVAAAFPEFPSYGGRFSEVLPHLTLAHGGAEPTLEAVESAMDGRVDVREPVRDVVIYARDPSGRWTEGPRVPLAGRRGA